MHFIRTTEGRVLARSDYPLPEVRSATGEDLRDAEELAVSLEEFEATAREDAGVPANEPVGDIYLTEESAEASPSERNSLESEGKPGRRVGHDKRLRAYAPKNPVTELMQKLGANPNQSVSWSQMEEVAAMIQGRDERLDDV